MIQITQYKSIDIYNLTSNTAKKYAIDITTSLDQIPLTGLHTIEALLSKTKKERVLYGKWEHSLIALTQKKVFAGVIIGYERKAENNTLYPDNSIYLNDFAIHPDFQKKGLGRALLKAWIDHNSQLGFIHLTGNVCLSVQTNSAPWNRHVQALYESFGFNKIGEKTYSNRVDNVYLKKIL